MNSNWYGSDRSWNFANYCFRFAANLDIDGERRKPAVSRMKQMVNNNSSNDIYQPPHTVVIQQGKKVRTSIKQHEQQQDELFEL